VEVTVTQVNILMKVRVTMTLDYINFAVYSDIRLHWYERYSYTRLHSFEDDMVTVDYIPTKVTVSQENFPMTVTIIVALD
jgi:hypothetical protein